MNTEHHPVNMKDNMSENNPQAAGFPNMNVEEVRCAMDDKKDDAGFVMQYHDYLNQYPEALATLRAIDISLFRFVHNPTNADDGLPQIFQENYPYGPDDVEQPAPDAPLDAQLAYIGRFALSHFRSVEAALKSYRKFYKKQLERGGEAKAKDFINQKGEYIVKIDYTSTTARIGEFDKKGHVNVFLAEDVKMEDLIDRSFTPIKTLDYDNEP